MIQTTVQPSAWRTLIALDSRCRTTRSSASTPRYKAKKMIQTIAKCRCLVEAGRGDARDNDLGGNVYGRASSSGSSFLMLIRSCAFSPMSSASEPATKIDEYVPISTPMMMEMEKPPRLSPAKKYNDSTTNSTEKLVIKVRDRV